MPPFVDDNALKPLRVLCYGPPKSKKTWWAAKAAEAGYNVIVVDGDDGTHIIQQISDEAKQRVQIVDAIDSLNKSVMAPFMTHLLKGRPFLWDEQTKLKNINPKGANPEHSYYYFDVSKLTMNDVLVIDSWTALAWSVAFRYSLENNIDLSDAEKPEWDGYRWCGSLLNWMLNQLSALKCHIVIIGHQDNYEKKKADGKTTEFTRMQIKSISGPHAMQIAKHFSDILFFKIQGSQFKIDTSADTNRDGGCRNMEPGSYKWEDLQFSDVAKAAGLPEVSPVDCTALKYFAPGDEIEIEAPSATKPGGNTKPLQAAGAAAKDGKGASISGLMKKS